MDDLTYDLGYRDATTGAPISDQDAGARPLGTSALRDLVLAARTLYDADEWPTSDQRERCVQAVIEATDRLPYDVDKALGVPNAD